MQKYLLLGFIMLLAGVALIFAGVYQYGQVAIPGGKAACSAIPSCVQSVHNQWQQALYVVVGGMVIVVVAAILIALSSFKKNVRSSAAPSDQPAQDLNNPFA